LSGFEFANLHAVMHTFDGEASQRTAHLLQTL
jgi:hypothetical protein